MPIPKIWTYDYFGLEIHTELITKFSIQKMVT